MATDASFVAFICEQADMPHRLTFKKMFGEYALYVDGKVIAFVCDNQLFLKPHLLFYRHRQASTNKKKK